MAINAFSNLNVRMADRRNVFSVVEMKFKRTGYGNLVQRCIGIYFFLVDINAIHWDGQFVNVFGIISTSPKRQNGHHFWTRNTRPVDLEPKELWIGSDIYDGFQGCPLTGFFESEMNRWIRRFCVASKKKPLLCGRDQQKSKKVDLVVG